MADGFLGRWSKRKLDVQQGKAVEEEPPREAVHEEVREEVAAVPSVPSVSPAELKIESAPATADVPAPPTLEDVRALTAESDFKRFVAPDVAPEVKNAALKKLFSDPHYNVMDRLDVYIDDYSQPDPMPDSMLRQLASAQFLGLFKDKEARDDADDPPAPSMAQSDGQHTSTSEPEPEAVPEPQPHADPDLRLQQDHAAPGKIPGRGAG